MSEKIVILETKVESMEKNIMKYRDEHNKLLKTIVEQNTVMARIDTKVEFMTAQINKIEGFLSNNTNPNGA